MESKLKVITKKLIISFFSLLLLLLGLFNLQVNALNKSGVFRSKNQRNIRSLLFVE